LKYKKTKALNYDWWKSSTVELSSKK